jgi:hypothetical protein
MNLKTATPEALEALYLPGEALAALAEGREWEYTPDSVEGADADVSYCDDCDTYHINWSVWGLRLDADGVLYETVTLVDTDGDWSYDDEYPVGEFDHSKEYADTRARWRAYYGYVARTGLDPVNDFAADVSLGKHTTWVVQFAASIVGPRVVRVRRAKGGTYMPLAEAPGEVRSFLADTSSFTSMDDLRERGGGLTWSPGTLHRATFTVYTPAPRTWRRAKAELRRRARARLASND